MDSAEQILQIKVSLKGRLLKTLRFSGSEINIGRDPESDICLDNPGVSRQHCRLVRSNNGFLLQDLDSANGSYLNDSPVRRCEIRDQDVVRVGKFSLWLEVVDDRRDLDQPGNAAMPVVEGTTVLKTDQLERMLESVQKAEAGGVPVAQIAAAPNPQHPTPVSNSAVPVAIVSFVVGAAVGAVVTWMILGGVIEKIMGLGW